MSSIKNRRSERLIQKKSNKKSSSSNSNKNRQPKGQSKKKSNSSKSNKNRKPTRQSKKKSNSSKSNISNKSKSNKSKNSNKNSSNNNECLGWIPKGTIFKPSQSAPDGFGYIIIEYIKKDGLYICGNIASHHKDMNGTPLPCKLVEEVITAEWQPKQTRDAIKKLKN